LGEFDLAVEVRDGNGGVDTATVKVELENVNDAPEFLSGTDTPTDAPNDDVYNFDAVKEGSKSGALVGTVKAVDADGDTLSYSFVGGELTNGVFSIDPTSGAITLNQDIDDADLGEFDLAVEVRDGNGGVDTATVKVELENVNDAPEFLSGTDTPTDAPNDDVYNFDAVKEGS
ncbi:hypothetical protein AKJ18_22445, partial [Vibrio xuii]